DDWIDDVYLINGDTEVVLSLLNYETRRKLKELGLTMRLENGCALFDLDNLDARTVQRCLDVVGPMAVSDADGWQVV
ncbi:MAG: hypothetical protein HN348_18515, partial [Proteobacteria bacterium]|nr:hypothetical protein [Pseudomonadota bacterium]